MINLNRKSENFNEMKRLCQAYLDEMKEESPDYGHICNDIAEVCVNYMLEIGEIKI
jgi:hypothetical protein